MVDDETNTVVGDFCRKKVRETIKDLQKLAVMLPRHFAFCGKRLIVDTGFYEIFNQSNVHPHDIRTTPIVRITESGVETSEGEVELDMLVVATGFDASTGTFSKMDIRGRKGETLNEHWQDGALSVMGLAVHNFPNLLMINGPGAPGPFSNVVISNEWCIEGALGIIDKMESEGLASVEADPTAEKEWMNLVDQLISPTFFAKTDNWYTGVNVSGKKTGIVNYPDPVSFRQKIVEAREKGYPGLKFHKETGSA